MNVLLSAQLTLCHSPSFASVIFTEKWEHNAASIIGITLNMGLFTASNTTKTYVTSTLSARTVTCSHMVLDDD